MTVSPANTLAFYVSLAVVNRDSTPADSRADVVTGGAGDTLSAVVSELGLRLVTLIRLFKPSW